MMTRILVSGMVLGLVGAIVASAGVAAAQPATVSLTVQVGVRAPNGAQSASASASAPDDASPVEPMGGVEVRAVVPGASSDAPAASAITDTEGTATLDLAPGSYWVFVARSDPPASGPLGAVLSRSLPDGTLAPAWEAIDLSDGNPATVLLVVTQLNP
jgi:hypothetical protein